MLLTINPHLSSNDSLCGAHKQIKTHKGLGTSVMNSSIVLVSAGLKV